MWMGSVKYRRYLYSNISETFLFYIYSLEFNNMDNRYHILPKRVYSSRWIDILFSFFVESDLLLDTVGFQELITRRISKLEPIITI